MKIDGGGRMIETSAQQLSDQLELALRDAPMLWFAAPMIFQHYIHREESSHWFHWDIARLLFRLYACNGINEWWLNHFPEYHCSALVSCKQFCPPWVECDCCQQWGSFHKLCFKQTICPRPSLRLERNKLKLNRVQASLLLYCTAACITYITNFETSLLCMCKQCKQ